MYYLDIKKSQSFVVYHPGSNKEYQLPEGLPGFQNLTKYTSLQVIAIG